MSSPEQHEFRQRDNVAALYKQWRRLEAEEKLLASEVRSLRGEVEEMATESMNAEVKVQQEEGRVSMIEVRFYKKAEETLQLLKDGNAHGWTNIRSWIGWEDCGWEPNYY